MNNQYTLHLLPQLYLREINHIEMPCVDTRFDPKYLEWEKAENSIKEYPIIGTFTGKEGDIWEEGKDFQFQPAQPKGFVAIPIIKPVEGKVNIDLINKLISQKESEPGCNCEIEGHYYKQVPKYNACPKHEPERYAEGKVLQKKEKEVIKSWLAAKSVESVITIDDSISYAKHWAKKELGGAFQTQPVGYTQDNYWQRRCIAAENIIKHKTLYKKIEQKEPSYTPEYYEALKLHQSIVDELVTRK